MPLGLLDNPAPMALKFDGMVLVADLFLEGRALLELEWDLQSRGVQLGWSPTGSVAQAGRESGTEGHTKWHRGTASVAQPRGRSQPWHVLLSSSWHSCPSLGVAGAKPALIAVGAARSCCGWDTSWGTGTALVTRRTLQYRAAPFRALPGKQWAASHFPAFCRNSSKAVS